MAVLAYTYDPAPIALIVNRWGMDPSEFATKFLENRRLPAYGAYAYERSAVSWLKISGDEAEIRRRYEAGAWEALGLREALGDGPVLNVIGLAVGDGLGELELLRKLLDEKQTVHYLAIDLSPALLVGHLQKIREQFASALRAGRLFCVGVLADVFTEIGEAVQQARAELLTRGAIKDPEAFFPTETPLVATFLGNCLGNDLPGREGVIFEAISNAFPHNRPLAIMVGVSVKRTETDYYSSSWDDFLLETPSYLLRELNVLSSSKPKLSDEPDEFLLPTDQIRSMRCPPVKPERYSFEGVEGRVYKFFYRLGFDIEATGSGVRLASGSDVLLYSITKYDPSSLKGFLENHGYTVLYRPEYHQRVETELGLREYVVFAAITSSA